jgi:FMN-dependent NADH-azoreductase
MSRFRLDASIRQVGSHSREIADIVEEEWRRQHPDAAVLRRDLGRDPVAANAWPAAVAAKQTPVAQRTEAEHAAMAVAATEVDDLVATDTLLFAVPLYNWGVSQHFKAWVDLVVTDPRMASTVEPVNRGKPAVLVVVRGGGYGPGTPREGWDHATAWMRRILADVWQLDLRVIEAELTLVGVNPALDHLTDLAAQSRRAAEAAARQFGATLHTPVPA